MTVNPLAGCDLPLFAKAVAYLLVQLHRPSTAESTVVTRLQIRVEVIDIGGDVGVPGEGPHVRSALRNAVQHNVTEGVNVGKSIDKGGGEGGAGAILRAVAVIAGRVVPPEAVIGSCVGLAVHDAIELALNSCWPSPIVAFPTIPTDAATSKGCNKCSTRIVW
jgi:hypothetical protein